MIKNLNLLRTFECAARLKSYGKAANELYISQAAVSQQMRQLESTLDVKLFYRKNKDMLLTKEGQTLYTSTQESFRVLQQGLKSITKLKLTSELTLSSTPAFTTIWLMPRLLKFYQQNPDIMVKVISSATFDDLRQQHIDLAIRFGNKVAENKDNQLNYEYLGESNVLPVCSPKLMDKKEWKSPSDLFSHWLVTLENPGPYDWASWFKNLDMSGHLTHGKWIKVDNTDMAINAVLSGQGITLAADYLVKEKLDSGELIHPFDIPHPNPLKKYLVYNPDSSAIKRIEAFKHWLKQEWC